MKNLKRFDEALENSDDKKVVKKLIKDIQKLRNFGANVQDEGFKDAQKQIISLIKKALLD